MKTGFLQRSIPPLILWLIMFYPLGFTVRAEHSSNHLEHITLQLSSGHHFQFAGFYAARELGYYHEAGLNVQIQALNLGDLDPLERVLRGDIDFAVGDTRLLIERSHYRPIKLLANFFQKNPIVFVTAEDSGIETLQQLRHRKVVVSDKHAAALAILHNERIDIEQLDLVHYSSPISALLSGQVDAISADSTEDLPQLKRLGFEYRVLKNQEIENTFSGNNLYTSEGFLLRHPDITREFVNASIRGWQYALKNPNEVIEIILRKYGHQFRNELEDAAPRVAYYVDAERSSIGEIDLDQFDQIIKSYQLMSAIPLHFHADGMLDKISKTGRNIMRLNATEKKWINNNPVIQHAVNSSLPPFEYIDDNGHYQGMLSEIMEKVSALTGIQFKPQARTTWTDDIDKINSNTLGLITTVTPSPQMQLDLKFIDTGIHYPMVIVTRDNENAIRNINQLKDKKVLIVADIAMENLLRVDHPGIQLIPVNSQQEAMNRLSSGQARAFIGNLASITQAINTHGYNNLRIDGNTEYNFSIHLGVSTKNPSLFRILDKAFGILTKQDIQKVRENWININYEPEPEPLSHILLAVTMASLIMLLTLWNLSLRREVRIGEIATRELEKSERKFRQLFEDNQAIQLIINPVSYRIIAANKAAIDYYGYSDSVIMQLTLADITVFSAVDSAQESPLGVCLDPNKLYYRHQLANGRIRDVEIHSGPIEWEGQQLSYLLIHDITERIRAEKALISAKSDAEQATRVKSDFLANMTHEIRTPMNSVLGMTELLKETSLDDEQQELLDLLQNSSQTLISIINDILDFSKLEANKMVAEKLPFQLAPLLQRIVESLRISATNKGLDVNLDIKADTDVIVFSDPTRLQQILNNLLGNAIKFTHSGHINLIVSQTALFEDNALFRFKVIDTGIGIRKESLGHLFETFAQAEDSITREYGGTGLGLAICQKLVYLLNGNISVQSEYGHGTTFNVEIPMEYKTLSTEEIESRDISKRQKSEQLPHFDKQILIAEDIKPNQILLQKMLTKFGLKVDLAENGEEAVNRALAHRYDLILMDCQMPVMDGFIATREIRTQNPNTPIIALTANVSTDDHRKAIMSGMNEVLTKPISISELSEVLQRWL